MLRICSLILCHNYKLLVRRGIEIETVALGFEHRLHLHHPPLLLSGRKWEAQKILLSPLQSILVIYQLIDTLWCWLQDWQLSDTWWKDTNQDLFYDASRVQLYIPNTRILDETSPSILELHEYLVYYYNQWSLECPPNLFTLYHFYHRLILR